LIIRDKMKLTRRQLRRIIQEAMYDAAAAEKNVMKRIEREHDNETLRQIQRYTKHDDPATQVAGHELASGLSGKFHPSEDFDDDALRHALLPARAMVSDQYGDIDKYLEPEQLKAISQVRGKDIRLGLDIKDGIEVTDTSSAPKPFPGLDSWALSRIAGNVYDGYFPDDNKGTEKIDHNKSFRMAERAVIRSIINLANTTVVEPFIDGETIGVTIYNPDLWDIGVDPYFKDLQVSGKLILPELPVEDD